MSAIFDEHVLQKCPVHGIHLGILPVQCLGMSRRAKGVWNAVDCVSYRMFVEMYTLSMWLRTAMFAFMGGVHGVSP